MNTIFAMCAYFDEIYVGHLQQAKLAAFQSLVYVIHCINCFTVWFLQGLMNLPGRPVAAFDPEGLIFAAGISSESLKLYDLRSFDKVWSYCMCEKVSNL